MEDDVVVLCVIFASAVGLAALFVVFLLITGFFNISDNTAKRQKNVNCLIIAGSGGHTTEILRLMSGLRSSYSPCHYVIANTDTMSEEKIRTFQQSKDESIEYHIHKIPRSREVSQSWLSTVLSTVHAFYYSIPLLYKLKPDLVLSNGPGTGVPLVLVAAVMSMLGIQSMKIIYVESICRVLTLSLSAKLVYFFCTDLLVQWPQLQRRYPGTKYIGRLV